MLLELAVIGLIGYAAFKNPEGMQKVINNMDNKIEKDYQNGKISDSDYQEYRDRMNR